MKKLICLSMVLLAPVQVRAVGGSIGAFSDGSASSCNILDTGAIVTVAIVHVLSNGSAGVNYSAPVPACASWTFLDETVNFGPPNPGAFSGSSPVGMSIGYGLCLWAPPPDHVVAHLTTMRFSNVGIGLPCCHYTVQRHPLTGDPTPVSLDCSPIGPFKEPASGGQAIIKSNPTCQCTVPNEESTWGVIKALYLND